MIISLPNSKGIATESWCLQKLLSSNKIDDEVGTMITPLRHNTHMNPPYSAYTKNQLIFCLTAKHFAGASISCSHGLEASTKRKDGLSPSLLLTTKTLSSSVTFCNTTTSNNVDIIIIFGNKHWIFFLLTLSQSATDTQQDEIGVWSG